MSFFFASDRQRRSWTDEWRIDLDRVDRVLGALWSSVTVGSPPVVLAGLRLVTFYRRFGRSLVTVAFELLMFFVQRGRSLVHSNPIGVAIRLVALSCFKHGESQDCWRGYKEPHLTCFDPIDEPLRTLLSSSPLSRMMNRFLFSRTFNMSFHRPMARRACHTDSSSVFRGKKTIRSEIPSLQRLAVEAFRSDIRVRKALRRKETRRLALPATLVTQLATLR